MSGQWPELERNLREGMKRSGIFKPEMLESAIEKIKANFSSIDNLTCFDALKRGRELTLAEKRGLGLNSRRKYLDDFISYIDLAGLNGGCPNVIYQDVFMDAVLRTGRAADLERMKAAGVKKVELLDAYGGMGCSAVWRARKTYEIAEAPTLPLPHCDLDYCKCSYIAKVF
ncbi:MAG: hypothetical protein WDM81_20640 [Rhizomicrobium sp.]